MLTRGPMLLNLIYGLKNNCNGVILEKGTFHGPFLNHRIFRCAACGKPYLLQMTEFLLLAVPLKSRVETLKVMEFIHTYGFRVLNSEVTRTSKKYEQTSILYLIKSM